MVHARKSWGCCHDQPGCGWLNCNTQTYLAATVQKSLSPKRYCFALRTELIKCFFLLFLFIRITTASHSLLPPHHWLEEMAAWAAIHTLVGKNALIPIPSGFVLLLLVSCVFVHWSYICTCTVPPALLVVWSMLLTAKFLPFLWASGCVKVWYWEEVGKVGLNWASCKGSGKGLKDSARPTTEGLLSRWLWGRW